MKCENMVLTSYLDKLYFVASYMQQFETPSKRTIFVARQIYLVARHNFHVTSVVTLYHDCKTSKCCNRCIFSFTTCELLRHVAWCCAAFVWCIMKHLFHQNIIINYVLLHFEHKNDITIIIKLQRANNNDCDIIFMFKM